MKCYKWFATGLLLALTLTRGSLPVWAANPAPAAQRSMSPSNSSTALPAASTLATYTHPKGLWSVQYPANLLHVEQLNQDVVIFISKDRHTFAAVDSSMEMEDLFRKTGSNLRRRAAETLALLYGTPVKVTGAVESASMPWETGITFTTLKGSTGTALYEQRGRTWDNFRVYGFLYGYKTYAEATMLPILLRMRASFLNTAPEYRQDLNRARAALISYFALLHDKRYSDAVQFYGGTYDELLYWLPDVPPNDRAKLFENACTRLLHCFPIKNIVHEEVMTPAEFAFGVEFMDEYGGVFEIGPCCGATAVQMPTETRFMFTVKKVNNRFFVQRLPLYVP